VFCLVTIFCQVADSNNQKLRSWRGPKVFKFQPAPSARDWTGVTSVDGILYVFGGFDGSGGLYICEEYCFVDLIIMVD
jgi:hypothetical protein